MAENGNYYIAVDLGAESGRVMLGNIEDEKISLEQVHRFSNGPVEQGNSLRWDFGTLLANIKDGIKSAVKQCSGKVQGIAVDSWGVDFGLIGNDGKLLENPHHYRDSRTNGMVEKACKIIPHREIYNNTGIQFMQINSVFQLLSMKLAGDQSLDRAEQLLFMADLVAYHLCNKVFAEYTLASTSQMMDMATGKWSEKLLDTLKLPKNILPQIIKPGTAAGKLDKAIADDMGCEQIPVIAVGSHDTASAVAAVPACADNWAYISSGTWSLIGAEIPAAIINDSTYEYEFTNEGGVENTIRLLKNVAGMWLVQECRKQWQSEGQEFSYAELTEMASKAEPFTACMNPDAGDFLAPGQMPSRINEYLKQNGQSPIEDKGRMIRMILESLACRYRQVIGNLENIIGSQIDVLHIVGGGCQNELLNQLTADATGKTVVAGPVEATALGNVIVQAIAVGKTGSLSEGRKIIQKSFDLKEYKPRKSDNLQAFYKKFEALVKN